MRALDFLVWVYAQSPCGYVKWMEDWPCTYPQPNLFDCLYGAIAYWQFPSSDEPGQEALHSQCVRYANQFIKRGVLEGVPGYWIRIPGLP